MNRTVRIKGISERKIGGQPGGPFPTDPNAKEAKTVYFIQGEFTNPDEVPEQVRTTTIEIPCTLAEAQEAKIGTTMMLG